MADASPAPFSMRASYTGDIKKKLPETVELTAVKGCGRALLAMGDIAAGEVVLVNAPWTSVLLPSLRKRHCGACFVKLADSSTRKRCGRCKQAVYCGRDCQRRDWNQGHRVECAGLASLDVSPPGLAAAGLSSEDELVSALLLGRSVRRARKQAESGSDEDAKGEEGSDSAGAVNSSWGDVLAMVSHIKSCKPAMRSSLEASLACATRHGWLSDRDLTALGGSAAALRLLAAFAANNFTVMDDMLSARGAAVYPAAALLNHGCQPNCVLTMQAGSHAATFRALRDIADGEQLTHSYVDAIHDVASRRQQLSSRYSFLCRCRLCRTQAAADSKEAESGDGAAAERRAALLAEAERHAAAAACAEGEEEEAAALQRCLELRSAALPASHAHVVQTVSALLGVRMLQAKWEQAALLCRQLLDAYQAVYPRHHPLIGLQAYTLGDLLNAVAAPAEEVAAAFQLAGESLSIAMGAAAPLAVAAAAAAAAARGGAAGAGSKK